MEHVMVKLFTFIYLNLIINSSYSSSCGNQ